MHRQTVNDHNEISMSALDKICQKRVHNLQKICYLPCQFITKPLNKFNFSNTYFLLKTNFHSCFNIQMYVKLILTISYYNQVLVHLKIPNFKLGSISLCIVKFGKIWWFNKLNKEI